MSGVAADAGAQPMSRNTAHLSFCSLGALLALSGVLTLAPAVRAAEAPAAATTAGAPRAAQRVDVNSASEAELEALPRIGPALAKRIVEYRKQVGTIKTVDELVNVKGIGTKMLEVLRPLVTVTAPAKKS